MNAGSVCCSGQRVVSFLRRCLSDSLPGSVNSGAAVPL